MTIAEELPPIAQYEYAGFLYAIEQDCHGDYSVMPMPGQHSAAHKQKHRQAALASYLNDKEIWRSRSVARRAIPTLQPTNGAAP